MDEGADVAAAECWQEDDVDGDIAVAHWVPAPDIVADDIDVVAQEQEEEVLGDVETAASAD